MAKPKIRHLALFARNPKKLAEFYQSVFEMEVIGKAPDDTAFFLSDGYLTLAVLPHRLTGEVAVGLNHFGFQVEDTDALADKLAAYGLEDPKERPSDRPYAEHRACDPEGNMFDLSVHGFQQSETAPERAAKSVAKSKDKALV
jgi:catechol 2,3-dioxygenase-like lactoylglutathione lyase family enzyme